MVLNTQLQNIQVMSLQSGGSLGSADAAIIDPRKLQVVAYTVIGPRIQESSVLYTSDIRELGPLGFIVNSADCIMPLDEDLIRLQEVVSLNFSLIGKQVIDDTRQKLGKISEYILDSQSFMIQKIHVNQSLLRNLKNTNLVIHRTQIIEVTDKEVIVRSATIQQPVGLGQVLNPFRKSQIAPETMQQK